MDGAIATWGDECLQERWAEVRGRVNDGLELAAGVAAVGGALVGGVAAWRAIANRAVSSGTGAYLAGSVAGGQGLGRLTNSTVRVTDKGLAIVEKHLTRFDPYGPNIAMVGRLRQAMAEGRKVSGADASFYVHELAEATMMNRGMTYEVAHPAALQKYGVSDFSVYHPDVVRQFNLNSNWKRFWGIE